MKHKKYGKRLIAMFLALMMVLSTPSVALADEGNASADSEVKVEAVENEVDGPEADADVETDTDVKADAEKETDQEPGTESAENKADGKEVLSTETQDADATQEKTSEDADAEKTTEDAVAEKETEDTAVETGTEKKDGSEKTDVKDETSEETSAVTEGSDGKGESEKAVDEEEVQILDTVESEKPKTLKAAGDKQGKIQGLEEILNSEVENLFSNDESIPGESANMRRAPARSGVPVTEYSGYPSPVYAAGAPNYNESQKSDSRTIMGGQTTSWNALPVYTIGTDYYCPDSYYYEILSINDPDHILEDNTPLIQSGVYSGGYFNGTPCARINVATKVNGSGTAVLKIRLRYIYDDLPYPYSTYKCQYTEYTLSITSMPTVWSQGHELYVPIGYDGDIQFNAFAEYEEQDISNLSVNSDNSAIATIVGNISGKDANVKIAGVSEGDTSVYATYNYMYGTSQITKTEEIKVHVYSPYEFLLSKGESDDFIHTLLFEENSIGAEEIQFDTNGEPTVIQGTDKINITKYSNASKWNVSVSENNMNTGAVAIHIEGKETGKAVIKSVFGFYRPDDSLHMFVDVINVTVKDTKKQLTGFTKGLVSSEEDTPDGITGITYPENDKVVISDGSTVKLLYKLTVTGDEGAKFIIEDKDAVLVESPEGVVQDSQTGKISGTIPAGGSIDIYVTKTFTGDNITNGKLTNTATITPGSDTTGPDDSSSTSEVKAEEEQKTTYILKYDTNGGTGAPADQIYGPTSDNSYTFTVSRTIPTRDGYTFLGWANVKDSKDVDYYSGDGITLFKGASVKTIYAVWEEENTSKFPVHLVIYRNGNTETPYKTVLLANLAKGETCNLASLKIEDYYSGTAGEDFEFEGWYNDGGWNSYKAGNKGNVLGNTITVNGWTNIICMVTDYENVIVYAVTNGDKANAEKIFTGKALRGTDLLEYLESNVENLDKEGYTLDKWFNWDWYGHKFADGAKVSGWTNVYVTYTANIYKVTFDPKGGICDTESKEVTYDKAYGELPVPTCDGYVFKGWTLKDGSPVDKDTIVKTSEDHTLYAVWEKLETVQIVIYRNNNTDKPYKTVSLPKMLKGEELKISILDINNYYNSSNGFEFEGWYNDGGWNSYKAGNKDNVLGDSITINGWTNIICMVTDYEKVVVKAVTDGDKANAETVFTGKALRGTDLLEYLESNVQNLDKEGYTLDKWFNWDWYGHKFTDGTTVNGWTNVYVTYTINQYPVTLCIYKDGDTSKPVQTIPIDNFNYQTALKDIASELNAADYYTEKNKFAVGYEIEDAWYAVRADGSMGEELTGTDVVAVNGSSIACMVYDQYPVYYTVDGVRDSAYDVITARTWKEYKLRAPEEKEGYEFDGWYQDKKDIGTDSKKIEQLKQLKKYELYGVYSPCRYTVTFDPGLGTCDQKTKVVRFHSKYGNLPDAVREGYTFTGWTLNGNLITNTSVVKIPRDHTLTATYEANQYTIIYHGNGGYLTSNPEKDQTTSNWKYDQEVTLKNADTFTRENWAFLGWSESPDGKAEYAGSQKGVFNFTAEPDGEMHLYAVWTPYQTPLDPVNAAYRVEHYKEQLDGTYVLEEAEFPIFVEVENEDGTAVEAVAKTYEHYTENLTHSDRVASGIVKKPVWVDDKVEWEMVTLKLYYDLDEFEIVFEAGEKGTFQDTETKVSGNYKYGALYPEAPVVTAQKGYVFAGWYEGGKKIGSFPETVTADASYIAKYKADTNNNGIADDTEAKYSVTYNDGVDDEEIFKDQVYTGLLVGTDTPGFAGTPKRDGYTFKGWSPEISEKVSGTVTYRAEWEKNSSGKRRHHRSGSSEDTNTGNAAASVTANGQPTVAASPQTGDSSPILPMMALSAFSLLGITAVLAGRKKRDAEE